MKNKLVYLLAIVAMILSACEKNTFRTTARSFEEGKAQIKLGLFNAPLASTAVLAYLNGEKVSSPLVLPYPFPGGGFNTGGSSNGDYLAVDPGPNKLELFTTNVGTVNLISKFMEANLNFEANKKYTVYTTDTAENAVAVVAPDDATAPDSGYSRIRFINLMPNVPAVDFYKGATLLKSNVKYKEFTEFFDIEFGPDLFAVRVAGSPASSVALASRSITPTNRRIYSFLSRGYQGATLLRAPNVSAIVNQ